MSYPFIETHPRALAVYCSDGRFTDAVERLLHESGHSRLDTITLPGGAALLCTAGANLSEVDTVSRAAHFLIDSHGITHVALLAHQGCGYYRNRYARYPPERIEAAQRDHLAAAAKVLQRRHPGLTVRRYYARIEGDRITFEEQTPA